ncbi:MAG: hypothetical protein WDA18_05715 [Candidatus Ratteibacteria bacterium]
MVLNIGSRLELFVDGFIIELMKNLELRLHSPERAPLPVFPLIGSYATVIKDGSLYRAYYREENPSYKGRRDYSGHPGEITCYAESKDGKEWIFPSLGLFEVNGTRENNVILAGQPPFSHNFSPFLDIRSGVDEGERFKALAGHPGFQRKVSADGLHAFVSPDGIRWRMKSSSPVIPFDPSWSHAFDSQNVSFWSQEENCYVSYFRTLAPYAGIGKESSVPEPGETAGRTGESGRPEELRTISRATSSDFVHWSKPVAMNPNFPGEHLYTNQVHPYFRAPHIYIAFPTRYMAGRVGSQKTDPMLGSTDILFMTSRPGSNQFDRLFREAFIRPGLDEERWASRANYVALNVVPTADSEVSIYHASSGYRYVMRTDGFVSVRAGAEEGEFTTRPFTFEGNTLLLNVSTSAAGMMKVELRDPSGTAYKGFSLDECEPIVCDRIEHLVQWKGNSGLGSLAGKPVCLRVLMKEADLYSFCFR